MELPQVYPQRPCVCVCVQIKKFALECVSCYWAWGEMRKIHKHNKIDALFPQDSIVIAIHRWAPMEGVLKLHTPNGNYSSSFSFSLLFSSLVNFNLESSTSLYDKVEWKPTGTEIDVNLAVSLSVSVITTTSYLSGTILMLIFSMSDNTIR